MLHNNYNLISNTIPFITFLLYIVLINYSIFNLEVKGLYHSLSFANFTLYFFLLYGIIQKLRRET